MNRTVSEPLSFVNVVHKRANYLQVLSTPSTKPDLKRELDLSRSAINYAIRELETHGFAGRTDEGYELTLLGGLACRCWREYSTDLLVFLELAPVLGPLPTDSFDSVAPLRKSDATFSEPVDPDSSLRAFREWLASFDEFTLSLPCIDEVTLDGLVDCDAGSVTLVLPEITVRSLLSDRGTCIEMLVGESGVELFETPKQFPFGVSVGSDGADAGLALSFYSDAGHMTGVVLNDEDHATAWGTDVLSTRREDATPLSA